MLAAAMRRAASLLSTAERPSSSHAGRLSSRPKVSDTVTSVYRRLRLREASKRNEPPRSFRERPRRQNDQTPSKDHAAS